MSGRALWLRAEARDTERRAPLTPDGVAELVASGIDVTVEQSGRRVFPDSGYAAAGARLVGAGSWPDAPADTVVLGVKELPEDGSPLIHRHIFFGHAYKGQTGAAELLDRFRRGGGVLLDLEYLVDDDGRRLIAFGYWAGYVGAALGVLALAGQLPEPLTPTDRGSLDAAMRAAAPGADVGAVVMGSLGRAGTGARAALEVAGFTVSAWDREETLDLDHDALLAHDLLVNCVLATTVMEPFVRNQDLDDQARRLRVLADVTCDVTSPLNVLPVSDRLTSWDEPVRRLVGGAVPLDAIVIDNLPSLVPREASEDFSAGLVPVLLGLWDETPPWRRARETFAAQIS